MATPELVHRMYGYIYIHILKEIQNACMCTEEMYRSTGTACIMSIPGYGRTFHNDNCLLLKDYLRLCHETLRV